MIRIGLLAALVLLCAACGTSGERPADAEAAELVPTVPFEESSLVVNVSSQSLDRASVSMRVEVDGQVVADRVFETGGGHTNVPFPLQLVEGSHRVVATADDGDQARPPT